MQREEISRQEYVLFAAIPVEGVHEGRIMDGRYDDDLQPILKSMREVEAAYGLSEEEYWPVGEAPEEYERLRYQYSSVLDSHFALTLREFGLDDLAGLHERDREEFDRFRERGRRSVFHQDELVPALRDIVVRYEEDARRAASAKAYSAAVTLLGAGVEGLLLIRCLRSKHKACRIAQELPNRKRPRCAEDLTKWTFDNL
ncbi:MAG TPA: hypothetical protein VKM72_19560 [Thermoanaerobaculia bacterium]|nr:hypothetical protein [Thermoanaerobaculia bacterium]